MTITAEDYALLNGIKDEGLYPIFSNHELMHKAIKLENQGLITSAFRPGEDAVDFSLTPKGEMTLRELELQRARG